MKRFFYISLLVWLIGPARAQSSDRILQILSNQNLPLSKITVSLSTNQNPKTTQEYITDFNGEISVALVGDLTIYIKDDIGDIIESNSLWPANLKRLELHINTLRNTIDPVSITGTLSPKTASQSPYLIDVISKFTIQKMAAQNLGDVLQNQSNIQMNQDAILGNSIQLQGLGGQNVKILINGVPMIGRLNGNLDISQIPMSNVERIEIIEGPMSVIYGSDAIGGIINVITKKPLRQKKSITANTYFDGVGNKNFDANIQLGNFKNSSKWSASVDGGRHFFEGRDFDLSTRQLDWKPKTKVFGGINLIRNSSRSTQTIRLNGFNEKMTDRSNAEYNLISVTGYNNYFSTSRYDFSIISDFLIGKNSKIQLQNSFNEFRRTKTMVHRDLVTGYEIVTGPEDQDTTVNRAINMRGMFSTNNTKKTVEWLTGYEFNHETILTKRVQNTSGLSDFSVYGTVDWTIIKNLQLKPSLRVIYNSQFGQNPFPGITANSLKLAPLIPSLQIKYAITPRLTFRGSYARGFRSPSIKELYFLFVDINHNVQGNPELKTETAHNFIASFDYRHKLSNKSYALFKASLFKNHVFNQIQLALIDLKTNLYQYINIGKMFSQGVTSQLELNFNNLNAKLTNSIISNQSLTSESSNWSSWNLVQTGLNGSYLINKIGLQCQMFTRFTSKTKGFDQNGNTYEIGSYYLTDISLSKPIKNGKLEVQVGCKNIFNVRQIASTAPATGVHSSGGPLNITPGRSFFINCRVNL